jgi:CheY-like chemotaxis protein
MLPSEYACIFPRPPRERLVAAERLLAALPELLPGAKAECELHLGSSTRFLALLIRTPDGLEPDALARLVFWTARTGGNCLAVSEVSEIARRRLWNELGACDRNTRGFPLGSLPDAAARLLRSVGSPPPAKGPPVLAIDLDGPGRAGLRYQPERAALFIAGTLAPPAGDRLALAVRLGGRPAPVQGWATVTEVVSRASAAPGCPAGFTLGIEGPDELGEALAGRVSPAPANPMQAAPRFAVIGRVKVKPIAIPVGPDEVPVPPPEAAADATGPRALLEYATDEQLAADWIENLSDGGAFVRTPRPHPEGTRLVLEFALPDGVRIAGQAIVIASTPRGMGVRFVLTREQDDVLAAAIARISGRARRVLVVDDDALVRAMLAEAFHERGFEVVTAADASEGIERLSEELIALDLLVTDVRMPGMGGEELIRFIRETGGEAELTIVAITGSVEPFLDRRLEAAGADAVLDKALGAEQVAAAADAALERKRATG